ncbi:hypothetical protein LCGC14_0452240 [marine sediment metagenome]|uniref:Uncharacterized protein n=1 Tax=marine sediment metagenome TaxID=412755 RepID=A0A0F9VRH5_9ZZZZ
MDKCEHCQKVQALVDKQAEDYGLWFISENIAQGYLQSALRELHSVIEGDRDKKLNGGDAL